MVDRHPKRHVLLATRAGLGLVSATLGVSVLTGNIRLWQIVVLALLFGTLSAVDNPARQAFVPESLDVAALHQIPPVRRAPGGLREGLRYAAHVPEIARSLR